MLRSNAAVSSRLFRPSASNAVLPVIRLITIYPIASPAFRISAQMNRASDLGRADSESEQLLAICFAQLIQ